MSGINLSGTTNTGLPSTIGINGFQTGQMAGAPQENPFSPFFGEPIKEFKLNPYNQFRRENLALPDAYKGPSPYMTQIIIKIVTDTDMWPVQLALPFRMTEESQEIQWDEIRFDNHLLGPVPEEGVSRLITQQVSERRDHYVRYGIAFLLEHGFMKTERGRLSYRMNLEQIRNAVIDTAYIGVIEAYLRSKQFQTAFTKKYGFNGVGATRLRTILAEETDMYAAVQKNDHGFDILDSRLKRMMSQNGVTPDLWILPQGIKIYLALARPENTVYALKGPDGQDVYKSALNGQNGVFMDAQNNCKIVETKSFELPGNARDIYDPLFRNVSVGEYNVMIDTVSKYLPSNMTYKSSMRDIFIYNEDRDNFSRITLKGALDNCNRFAPGTNNLWWPSMDFPADPNVSDMFITEAVDGTTGPAEYFGDMDSQYLSLSTITDFIRSVAPRVNGAPANFGARPMPAETNANNTVAYQNDVAKALKLAAGLFAQRAPKTNFDNIGKFPKHVLLKTISETLGLDVQDQLFNERAVKFASKKSFEDYPPTTAGPGGKEDIGLLAHLIMWGGFIKNQAFFKLDKTPYDEQYVYAVNLITLGLEALADEKLNYTDFCKQVITCIGTGLDDKKEVLFVKDFPGSTVEPTLEAAANEQAAAPAATAAATRTTAAAVVEEQEESDNEPPSEAAPRADAPGAVGAATVESYFGSYDDGDDEPQMMDYGANKSLFGAARRQTFNRNADPHYMPRPQPGDKRKRAKMADRFAEIDNSGLSPEEKELAKDFLAIKIDKRVLDAIVAADVIFPFSFLLLRPYITHRMGTAILTKAGAVTGETLIGHADFQLGDNVAQKMHYGNFTMYLKSLVYKADNVTLAENIYAAGYVRGNGITMHNLQSSGSKPSYKSGAESIYVCLIPYIADGDSYDAQFHSEMPNPLDTTGQFSNNAPQLVALDNADGNRKHYATSDFYARTYQFNNEQTHDVGLGAQGYVYDEVNRYNTVCYQGHQSGFNISSGTFDLVTEGTGHWGNRVYPGCGKVRKGLVKTLEPISYTTSFGVRQEQTKVGF